MNVHTIIVFFFLISVSLTPCTYACSINFILFFCVSLIFIRMHVSIYFVQCMFVCMFYRKIDEDSCLLTLIHTYRYLCMYLLNLHKSVQLLLRFNYYHHFTNHLTTLNISTLIFALHILLYYLSHNIIAFVWIFTLNSFFCRWFKKFSRKYASAAHSCIKRGREMRL